MDSFTRREFMSHMALGIAGMSLAGCRPFDLGGNAASRPNVLFIAVDDLNDWIGCLGGHPQSRTPNIDRLAASGVLFTNAHCAAPSCNPSRSAILTGISPHNSGIYSNAQKMRDVLPDAEIMPRYFADFGYWAAGSGKILHYFIDAASWDEYYPDKEKENPFPRTLYPAKRPVSLPVGGPWQYVETDWGPLDATDEEFGGDWLVSRWIGEQLKAPRDKPFFLACGIYRPHEPWFVPQKYFDLFPLDDIQLPPGYKEDDLEDLPPAGQRMGPNRYFAHIRQHGQWRQGIQGYLASIAFADAMVGRVLDALDDGPHRDNTIVVLWGDHGWHLGEKQHWQKYTGWRVCTRVPLVFRVPEGTPGLSQGTQTGRVCTRPVNLLSLFPTLTRLAGLPDKQDNDGPSLVPLLEDPNGEWSHASITYLSRPGSYSISTEDWRYIHYQDGGEELYNTSADRYEWRNLADMPEYAAQLERMRALAPERFASYVEPPDSSLPALRWQEIGTGPVPPSRPEGGFFNVVFVNHRNAAVELLYVNPQGGLESYGLIDPESGRERRRTQPGAVWLIADESGNHLGYFIVRDRAARADISDR